MRVQVDADGEGPRGGGEMDPKRCKRQGPPLRASSISGV